MTGETQRPSKAMRTIGRYELLTQLASGNTGYVFAACLSDDPSRSTEWQRRPHGPDDASHAVKLIKPRLAQEQRYAQTLRAEAPAAIAFRHKNATRIVEVAQVGTDIFIAMELVRGQTLASVLDRSASDRRLLSRELSYWIAKRAANAMELAHRTPWHSGDDQGMLHGEISPQSILITYEGDVRLLGVGLGRSRMCLPPARSRLPYRAPELFERKRAESGIDIYALGVVLYDALSGLRVFARDNVQETTQAVLEHPVRPLVEVAPDVGNAGSELVEAMMRRDPRDRPRSMAEVEAALSDALRHGDGYYESALAREMHLLFAEEMLDLPWVEFTPGFLDASSFASAAVEALHAGGEGGPWQVAAPRAPTAPPPRQQSGAFSPPSSQSAQPAQSAQSGAFPQPSAPSSSPTSSSPAPSSFLKSNTGKTPVKLQASPPMLPPFGPPTPPPVSSFLTPTPTSLTPPPVSMKAPDVDELDVDILVDAIVAASTLQRSPQYIAQQAKIDPTPSRARTLPGNGLPPMPGVPNSPFSRALDQAQSEDDVDVLVDAIVAASAQSRVPPANTPNPSRTPPTPPLIVKEGFHQGAIVDVSTDPRARRKSMLNRAFEDTAPAAKGSAAQHRMVVSERVTEPGEPPTPPPVELRSPDPSAPTAESEIAMLEPGEVIGGRYRVVEKLGSGGMAVVYKVEHTLLEKAMALKLLRPELSSVPYVVQRFHREARFVSQLDDPRIVRVIDFGRAENGSLFLVMELIEGEPLSQRMHDHNAMELDDAMRVIEQVLLGLDHAHKNNVIHRDLKPDNIMLIQRGLDLQVKIVDFGIAKLASADGQTRAATLTQAGMVFGSPRYMSPEQASGDVVDARTDIYAAGVIVYELLTGRRPFDGKSARAILSAALTQPAPPMNLTRPNKRVGQAIENVVLTALAKEKEQRYPSAGALLEALRGALKA